MMKEKKTFLFMGIFKVEVQIWDGVPEGFNENAVAGVYDEPKESKDGTPIYTVWFSGLVEGYVIMHESWHLFCTMMAHIDSHEHSWRHLNEEIYAYNFHVLSGEVLENLTSMKYYKKLYDERDKTNKEEKKDV